MKQQLWLSLNVIHVSSEILPNAITFTSSIEPTEVMEKSGVAEVNKISIIKE